MSTDFAAPIVPSAGPGLSQVERVVDTFVAPSKTFLDILRNTSWWLPFLLMAIFTTASNYVVDKQVGFDRVSENQMHQMPSMEERLNQLPPDQKAAQMARSATSTKYSTYAAPVFLAIFFAIYALIIWATFNFGLGAQTTFGQVFAVTWYAALPYILLSILTIVTLYAGNNADSFNLRNPVGTNPAYYFPDTSPVLKALLTWLDPIKLWSDVLMALGMSIIAKKSFLQSAMVIFGFLLVGVLFTVGLAVAFG